jgi:imidazolonepropionase-like amidohydrolase
MRNVITFFLFTALTALVLVEPRPSAAPRTLVFTHVTVIDATGADAKSDMTVVITGDRITGLGKTGSVAFAKAAEIVAARGKFLIPGLWDMHAHTSYKNFLTLFVANGVTGVRDMGGSPEEFELLNQWRKELEQSIFPGPRVVAAGIVVDGPAARGRPDSLNVTTAGEARQAVQTLKQRGADFIKVYSLLPRAAFWAIADEAKRQGMTFAGHVPASVSAAEAADAGQKSMEHLFGVLPACSSNEAMLRDEALTEIQNSSAPVFIREELRAQVKTLDTYDAQKAAALFARFAQNNTWQVPTLVGWQNLAEAETAPFIHDARLTYLPRERREAWTAQRAYLRNHITAEYWAHSQRLFRKQLDVVAAMHRAGVGILAGTDAAGFYVIPGFSLQDELGLLVEAGLTPMAALQAATRDPAIYLGMSKTLGTVEKGKIADLVLLDANPLADISHTKKIAGVVIGGKLISRAELDRLLAEVKIAVSLK